MKNVYEKVVNDSRYKEGVLYGKPRKGHQEGTVAAHIADLELNLDSLKKEHPISDEEYWKLKVLIHTHDTFKKWATRDSPIDHHNSHASLAAQFLAEFTDDTDLVKMVQWHDENFALWKQVKNNGSYSESRMSIRVMDIADLELFLMFTILDGYTPSKMALAAKEEPEKLRWFTREVSIRRPVPRAFDALKVFGL